MELHSLPKILSYLSFMRPSLSLPIFNFIMALTSSNPILPFNFNRFHLVSIIFLGSIRWIQEKCDNMCYFDQIWSQNIKYGHRRSYNKRPTMHPSNGHESGQYRVQYVDFYHHVGIVQCIAHALTPVLPTPHHFRSHCNVSLVSFSFVFVFIIFMSFGHL